MNSEIQIKETLKFSTNWNNKLNCNACTSIRLKNDTKFIIGAYYQFELKGENSGVWQLVAKKDFQLAFLDEFSAMLDTGYGAQQTANIIKLMYKDKVDVGKAWFTKLLFVRKQDA